MGLIRLLLAFSVVTVHAGALFGWPFTMMVYGKNAVQMFYTISGFYMALILNTKYTGKGSYRVFIASRFLRVYPAYATIALAAVAVGAVALLAFNLRMPLFETWARHWDGLSTGTIAYLLGANLLLVGQDTTMFLTIAPDSGSLAFVGERWVNPMAQSFMTVPQAWTVGTELWFYLLAPFLVRRVGTILLVMAGGIATRLVLFVGLGWTNSTWDYRFFPAELPMFMAGALGFHVLTALESRRFPTRRLGRIAFYGMVALILAHYKLPWRFIPFPRAALQLEPIEVIFPLALPFIFAYTKNNRPDRLIGELSYPVYLVHWLIIDILRVFGTPWVVDHLGTLTCFATLAAAIVIWYAVDRPVDAWRQTLGRRRASAGLAVQVDSPLPARIDQERPAVAEAAPQAMADPRLTPGEEAAAG